MSASPRTVARVTWQAAAHRAALAPERRLPCPGCAASVKGANLADHVHRVHLTGPAAMAPGHPIHVGHDRRLRRAGRWAVAAWLAALAGLVALAPDPFTTAATAVGDDPTAAAVRHHAAALARTPAGLALLAGSALVVVALVAGPTERARARLVVTDREVVLQHRFGTGIVRLALPSPLEVGTLVRRLGASGGGEDGGPASEAYDERVGTYLRIGAGRGAITIGCPQGTRLRKHWGGWSGGPTRRRWDVTLTPVELVGLQYALAAAGVLAPRPG